PEPEQPAETEPAATGETQEEAAGVDDMAAAMAAQAIETGDDNSVPVMINEAPPLAPHHEHHFTPGEGAFPMTGGDPAAFERRRAVKRAKQNRTWSMPKFHWPLAPTPTLLLGLGAIVVI